MSTIRICKKCNKSKIEKIEKAFDEVDIEVKYMCIKTCGKKLRGKANSKIYKGDSVKELVGNVVNDM